ncbi:MAG: phosphatidate cytidylyltransferase [Burkholderiales bacterium]|nr:phosphatidate cytidylyltransferase [Burkholderiales bacterium]
MLKQRIITALALLAVLLPALFVQVAWPFIALSVLMIGAAGWEWARLNGQLGSGALVAGVALGAAAAATALAGGVGHAPGLVWNAATLVWVLGGAWVLRAGVTGWPRLDRSLRLLLGLVLLWLAWLAIAQARVVGVNFLLSLLCLVWMADIAAYFAGRAFGRRKLAPAISPGKSWEGVVGGMVGVLALSVFWLWFDHAAPVDSVSLYGLLLQRGGVVSLVLGVMFLAAMSVVGDLFESLVKRAAGAKDSSQLLPGHGGVLDRIDALLPVCPLALGLLS